MARQPQSSAPQRAAPPPMPPRPSPSQGAGVQQRLENLIGSQAVQITVLQAQLAEKIAEADGLRAELAKYKPKDEAKEPA